MSSIQRTIGLAEIILNRSPVTIKEMKSGDSYSYDNTIVENLEIVQDPACGCYYLSGAERIHKFVYGDLYPVRDPEILATIDDEYIKEHNKRGWFSNSNYKYAQGWVRLKERKPFSATLCGELLIID